MTSRLLLLGLCLFTIIGCASTAELASHYDEEALRFCEVTVGDAPPRKLKQRLFTIENEGGVEQRLAVSLCAETIKGELALDERGRVQMIVLTNRTYCMHKICIGDGFRLVHNRHRGLKLFLSREEGGVLTLRMPKGTVRYLFDTGEAPGRCFDHIDVCPTAWNTARVAEIVIGAPSSPLIN